MQVFAVIKPEFVEQIARGRGIDITPLKDKPVELRLLVSTDRKDLHVPEPGCDYSKVKHYIIED